MKNQKKRIIKCSVLTAYIGHSVHSVSGAVYFLTRCVCMLLHKTANVSDECVASFYFKKEDKKSFIFVRSSDKIRALKKICAEYPDLISNEKLNELIKTLEDGFRARHFFAHTMIWEDDDGTVKIYKKIGSKKMELRTVTIGDLSDQYVSAANATLAIQSLHDRAVKFLQ